LSMYFVQLRIAPQNPKTPLISRIINSNIGPINIANSSSPS